MHMISMPYFWKFREEMPGRTARKLSVTRQCQVSLVPMACVPSLLLCLSLSLVFHHVAAAPDGFISIDCGSDVNYTDETTGLAWSTDDDYISTGSNQKTTALVDANSFRQLTTARYFTEGRKKNCYVLPVTTNNTYLVRAFFLLGDLEILSALEPTSFNLSIDSTVVDVVSLSATDIDNVQLSFEYIVTSSRKEIDFCIIPILGNAFISSLELRPLQPTMYMGVTPSKYMKLVQRLNCGAASSDPTVRFPDDKYDRLWLPPDETYNIGSIRSTNSSSNVSVRDVPPRTVMETAWTAAAISFEWSLSEKASSYYVALFLEEIVHHNSTDVRSVDVSLNDKVLSKGLVIKDFAQEIGVDDYQISGGAASFNLTRSRNATLNPLLNGAELHAIYPMVTTTTAATDVAALNDLRQSFSLLDWTGDPCLPVSWDWISCTTTDGSNPPRVTQLKLSNYGVNGTIPASIANLTLLTNLWLDRNDITGSIPNLIGLNSLRTLHLQNNSLSGHIPASLANLPDLSELFLQGNNLTGPVPAGLLRKNGLNVRVDPFTNLSTHAPAPAPGRAPASLPSPVPSPGVPSVSPTPSGKQDGSKDNSGTSRAKVGAVLGASAVWFVVAAVITYFCCRRRRKAKSIASPSFQDHSGQSGVDGLGVYTGPLTRSSFSLRRQMQRSFCLDQVRDATNNFRWKIGEGGFGPVYYGTLPTAEEIAVKVDATAGAQEMEDEFSTEVGLLSVVHHRNLLALLGFCEEDNHKILIYEYMQKGTLRDHLYGKSTTEPLDWRTRLRIALDAARGLEYLHHDCNPTIIHRDVKSNNILLNEKLQAKVADFGISKLAPDEGMTTGVITVVRGTTGYFDPEYFTTNKITHKSDVYAFGVVLLEIISGRAPNDNRLADASQANLVHHARRTMREGNLEKLIDPAMKRNYNVEAIWKVAELAMTCVEPLAINRPDMRDVVRELLEARNLEQQRELVSSSAHFAFVSSQEDTTQSSQTSDSSAEPNVDSFTVQTSDSSQAPNSDLSPAPISDLSRTPDLSTVPTVRFLQSGFSPTASKPESRRGKPPSLPGSSPSPSTAFLVWNDPNPR